MKTIILCGGMGTRLREETEYKPKPMVHIGGKPILWHIMKHYAHFGFNEFILALGYKGDAIREYFLNFNSYNQDFTVDLSNGQIDVHGQHHDTNWKVTLVETGESSMTGYRTKLAGKYIEDDHFMLTYGDAVADVNLHQLVDYAKQQDTIGTVTGVYPASKFGEMVTNGNQVSQFKQKLRETEDKEPINGGYFVFKKEFLDYIPNDPGADLELEAFDAIVKQNQLAVYRHKGFWQCMDTFRDNQMLNKMWADDPRWKLWKD
ncbi:sugar phosphate nucleotidyltransferase [Sunxiuqinia elliptica]|uniref:Glucose-1-phosphate cytidylyltransferase n=1 Tax=Sunxiuqinia elliptica TaxID=655355 RepID=A0A4R6H6Y8_9BACT|nr:sugar phosphate nucleotidyltransferase [Sunxiuqinia elliptica]TDO03331.1 glucose-1-phosphate cytidylyltransferase [Sunxiuqinia elliptica]TDO59528.1 glucose-1-phosphate cytidylyltransferase [Sunxiuqinia elliptica]